MDVRLVVGEKGDLSGGRPDDLLLAAFRLQGHRADSNGLCAFGGQPATVAGQDVQKMVSGECDLGRRTRRDRDGDEKG